MKKIAVLGSTGSIGQSTLKVARNLGDAVKVVALAAHSDIDLLENQINEFHPEVVAVWNESKALELKKRIQGKTKVFAGKSGVEELASLHSVDFVVVAIVGMNALSPTIAAIRSKKQIGLANKEVLVAAGSIITQLAKENNVRLIPIDSEHSAIFQCLKDEKISQVRKIILTASGGPFRQYSDEQLSNVTVDDALKHPNWNMGPKVTIDCSTLMNKGLEMIEAYWLFGLSSDKIEIIVHPQSIIHSLVEFQDGSMLAQMNLPDMVLPIQYAITYPERLPGLIKPYDFTKHARLDFVAPDFDRFSCLKLAYQAIQTGGSLPCFMNASNEVLVQKFIEKKISWRDISRKLEKLMHDHHVKESGSLEDLLFIDQEARIQAEEI